MIHWISREPCWTAIFTFRKFHTVNNWYQFFTAREEFVPMRHIFHTNISHFVKFAHVVKIYVAYMRNLHIDKKNPTQICCILQSIPILHIRGTFFMFVERLI